MEANARRDPALTVRPPWTRYATTAFQYGTATLGFAGLGLYAFLDNAYGAFYTELGVRPEEVGVTYLTVVGQAGSVAFYLALLVASTVTLLIAVPGAHRLIGWLNSNGALWSTIASSLSFSFAAVTYAIYRAHPLVVGYPSVYQSLSFYLVIAFALLLLPWVDHILSSIHLKSDPFFKFVLPASRPTIIRVLALIALVFAALDVVSMAGRYGREEAQQVKKGLPTDQPFVFSLPADPVCVLWVGADRPADLDFVTPLLYLGQSNGEMVFYSAKDALFAPLPTRSRGAIRFPASRAVLVSTQLSCPPVLK